MLKSFIIRCKLSVDRPGAQKSYHRAVPNSKEARNVNIEYCCNCDDYRHSPGKYTPFKQETNTEHLVLVVTFLLLFFLSCLFVLFLFYLPIPNPLFHLEEEWEKELEAELQDYEVVGEQKTNSNKGDNWEQEMEEMLEDEADLK